MGRVFRYGSATCEVVIDARFAPIYITCWRGAATLHAARWHSQQVDELLRELVALHPQLIAIDCATLAKRATPEARRHFAQRMDSMPQLNRDALIDRYVVVPNAMVRGAFTAVGWLNPRVRALKTTPTLEAALQASLESLDAQSINRPEGLDLDYVSPGAMSWMDRRTG